MWLKWMRKNYSKKRIVAYFLFAIFLSCAAHSISASDAQYVTQELEWRVEVGDTKTYIVTKLNKDGTPYKYLEEVDTLQGPVNITMKEGTTITLEILELNRGAHLNCIYNDDLIADGNDFCYYVRKTTTNKTYWAEQLDEGYDEVSFTEELIIVKREEVVNNSVNRLYVSKLNFMTGWLESEAVKVANSTHTFTEWELAAANMDLAHDTSFSFPIWFSALVLPILIYRKRRNIMK